MVVGRGGHTTLAKGIAEFGMMMRIGSEVCLFKQVERRKCRSVEVRIYVARKLIMDKIYFANLYKDYTDVAQTEGDPAMQ